MAWTFVKTPTYRKSFEALSDEAQKKAQDVFDQVFKHNPYDTSLKPHKIHKLSSRYGCPVKGIHIEGDLIVVFMEKPGQVIVSLDIGTQAIYR